VEGKGLKKIKVTRTAKAKLPWYERPVLLFTAIGAALLVLGVVMAWLSGMAREKALQADQVSATAPAAAEAALDPGSVLEAGAPLPRPPEGGLVPPIRVRLRAEGEQARASLRAALASDGDVSAIPALGYVDTRSLSRLGAQTAGADWEALPLSEQQRTWCDFELARGPGGGVYLLGFVALDVAGALGELAPDFAWPPPDTSASAPKWQFWKKKEAETRLRLRQGSRIELYPDLNPGAEFLVAIPAARLAPLGARSAHTGLATPMEVLEVELR